MGTNRFFEHNESIEVIKLMYKYLETGGSMLFNITWEKNINRIESKLFTFFDKKFEKINYKYYGAFHKPLPGFISFTLAYLMYFFPLLRTLFGLRKKRLYYLCYNKL